LSHGVDVYFDNVGGEISDAVISAINFHAELHCVGRYPYIIVKKHYGPHYNLCYYKKCFNAGFIVSNYQDRFPEGIKQLSTWVKEGKLDFTKQWKKV
jgi:NADPH-dependent curcumin reductase CurA